MTPTIEALGNEQDELATIGVACAAEEAFIQAKLAGKNVQSIRESVEGSVYWPRFVTIVQAGNLPPRWLPGPLGKIVAGWAGQSKTSSLSTADMHDAARQLAKSAKGRSALKALLRWLDDDGLSLDQINQQAALTLLQGAWGPFPGTARDEMRSALER